MEIKKYPRYYRKLGRAIKRISDVKAQEVRIPDNAFERLPLMMSDVTYPSKERFDEDISPMEEVDLGCYEDYIWGFIGRVEKDINKPMTERSIQKQLAQNQALNSRK